MAEGRKRDRDEDAIDGRVPRSVVQWIVWINLVAAPIVMTGLITWAVWQTSKTYEFDAFKNSGERFTQTDGRALRDEITNRNELLLRGLNAKIDANASRMNGLERDTTRILTIVERLESDRVKGVNRD